MSNIEYKWQIELKNKNDELRRLLDDVYKSIEKAVEFSEQNGLLFNIVLPGNVNNIIYYPRSYEVIKSNIDEKYSFGYNLFGYVYDSAMMFEYSYKYEDGWNVECDCPKDDPYNAGWSSSSLNC